jgi:DNA-binding CsgD family transcriptional regulator
MQSLVDLTRAEWGIGSRALADLFVPEADSQQQAWFTAYQRAAMSPQVAADFVAGAIKHDVRNLLPNVQAPTLVMHRRDDCLIPFNTSEYLAAGLPCAQLHALEGVHHAPYFGDSESVTRSVGSFLATEDGDSETARLSAREVEVLGLVASGLGNREISTRLSISPATTSRHLVNIYAKLGVSTRAAATAYALRNHLV